MGKSVKNEKNHKSIFYSLIDITFVQKIEKWILIY